MERNRDSIPEDHLTANQARLAAGRIGLPPVFLGLNKNKREYEKSYKKEIDGMNIGKQTTGNSMLTYTKKADEFKRLQTDPPLVNTDPILKKMTTFRKIQKPNRPMSKDYSFPFYKDKYTTMESRSSSPVKPGLRIGREFTTILDYTGFQPNVYNGRTLPPLDYSVRPVSRSNNWCLNHGADSHFNKTWPSMNSPKTINNEITFPRKKNCNINLQLNARKVILHNSAKQTHWSLNKPEWMQVLDFPHPSMEYYEDLPRDDVDKTKFAVSEPTPNDGIYTVKFSRGGGFISRANNKKHAK